jgi:hypothetical protein
MKQFYIKTLNKTIKNNNYWVDLFEALVEILMFFVYLLLLIFDPIISFLLILFFYVFKKDKLNFFNFTKKEN